ncbi:MAG TPA: LssY C-terminal domain-containing protein [Longimicrobiales bacterium]|nr:LssY C-terminal domain-containing protein [Longimicrobiales bacterium]
MLRALLPLLLAAGTVAGPHPLGVPIPAAGGAAGPAATLLPGTVLSIRFLERLTSGRTPVGAPVLLQTMQPLVGGHCVLVPAFARAAGHVTASRDGRGPRARGILELAFDSLEVRPGVWAPLEASLDTLEYGAPPRAAAPRTIRARPHSLLPRAAVLAMAGAAELPLVPVALLGGYFLAARGPRATILPGEVGALRLDRPLRLASAGGCLPPAGARSTTDALWLPDFVPFTGNRAGTRRGDPVNLLLAGDDSLVDAVFRRAGWVPAQRPSLRTLLRGAVATVAKLPAAGAPVSTQYFQGRRQDRAYELSGPNARFRHHVRLWRLDGAPGVWAAAASDDVGLTVHPFPFRATHRIDPQVDRERDLIAASLQATGCADRLGYATVLGGPSRFRNIAGQLIVTDGRAARLALHACPPAADLASLR